MKPHISIVLGTYQQRDALQKVLEAYKHMVIPEGGIELVIVDSSSTDGTDRMVANIRLPFPLRTFRQENRGKTGARNRAIREALGSVILLTDGDTIPDPRLATLHASFAKAFPHHVGVAKTVPLRSADADPYQRESQLSTFFDRLRKHQKVAFWLFQTGNASVPRELLLEAGLFDEDFQGYGWEDIELAYRLKKRTRAKFRYVPAQNFHYQFVAHAEQLQRKYLSGQSAALFLKKHPELYARYFILGFHPIAMGIYRFLEQHRGLVERLRKHYDAKPPQGIPDFKTNILYEFEYRRGAIDEAKRQGIKL